MRGPAELRPPVLQEGGGEPCHLPTEGWCGYLRSSGWGPFEAIALAEYVLRATFALQPVGRLQGRNIAAVRLWVLSLMLNVDCE